MGAYLLSLIESIKLSFIRVCNNPLNALYAWLDHNSISTERWNKLALIPLELATWNHVTPLKYIYYLVGSARYSLKEFLFQSLI